MNQKRNHCQICSNIFEIGLKKYEQRMYRQKLNFVEDSELTRLYTKMTNMFKYANEI